MAAPKVLDWLAKHAPDLRVITVESSTATVAEAAAALGVEPGRIAKSLAAMEEAFGGTRRAAVCRELTKTYEEVRRGTLVELVAWADDGVRGEITVVVAGAEAVSGDVESNLTSVLDRVAAGERLKDVCADVSAATGLSKKALYDAALAAQKP